jgi:hypothetical protein
MDYTRNAPILCLLAGYTISQRLCCGSFSRLSRLLIAIGIIQVIDHIYGALDENRDILSTWKRDNRTGALLRLASAESTSTTVGRADAGAAASRSGSRSNSVKDAIDNGVDLRVEFVPYGPQFILCGGFVCIVRLEERNKGSWNE